MLEKKLFIRKAEPEDLNLLFNWVNDERVRNNAFNTNRISYEEHKKWFNELLDDGRQMQFILLLGDEPIGQARLSVSDEEAEIDYSIAPAKRGMGYGKQLIHLIQEMVHNEYAAIKKLTAKVKASNAASIYCFKKNGFSEMYYQYEYDMASYQPREAELENLGGGG